MDTTLSIRLADFDDVNTIGFLAQQIWPSTYQDIVPAEHLSYMLNLFYNPISLKKQMVEERQIFLIVEQEEEAIGFASWSAMEEKGIYKLHKLYVLPGRQGKGLGKTILSFIIDDIKPQGATMLRLNVNRHNKARQFYEKMGFTVIREEDIHVGNNVYMNDYVMELPIA